LLPAIERLLLPGADGDVPVLCVSVERSLFVHRSPGGYMHRVGSAKRQMAPEYLARLFQQRSQARIIRFDEQLVHGASLADLSEPLWLRFSTLRTRSGREDLLHKLAMARVDDDGVWRPTVAGCLLGMADPRRFLPNAFIQAVAYRGTSPVPDAGGAPYQLDAADIGGPLDRQVEEAVRFVARNMRVRATKSMGRRDLPEYDLGAVFEAVVNAVAHRDYAIYGSKIRLRMFDDRLELFSPGALANSMTIESLPLRQSARNEAITSLLAKCPLPEAPHIPTDRHTLMDKRGEGVSIILERSVATSGRLPAYRVIDEAELMLTIWAAPPPGAPAEPATPG
jgi:predicted HTH transcriptional regulator